MSRSHEPIQGGHEYASPSSLIKTKPGFCHLLAMIKQHPQKFSVGVVRAPSPVTKGSISCFKVSGLVYGAESQLSWQAGREGDSARSATEMVTQKTVMQKNVPDGGGGRMALAPCLSFLLFFFWTNSVLRFSTGFGQVASARQILVFSEKALKARMNSSYS